MNILNFLFKFLGIKVPKKALPYLICGTLGSLLEAIPAGIIAKHLFEIVDYVRLIKIDDLTTMIVGVTVMKLYTMYEKKLIKHWLKLHILSGILSIVYYVICIVHFNAYFYIFADTILLMLALKISKKPANRFVNQFVFNKREINDFQNSEGVLNNVMMGVGSIIGYLYVPSINVALICYLLDINLFIIGAVWMTLLHPDAYKKSLTWTDIDMQSGDGGIY